MSGRPRKPTALKILEGNRGKRELSADEPKPPRGIPKAPHWLREHPEAMKEWRREVKLLDEMGVMTLADASELATRSYVGAEIHRLTADIRVEGRVIEVKAFNKAYEEVVLNRKTNPKCAQLAALLVEYRNLGTLLGLNPSGRSRLHTTKQEPASKFTGLIGGKAHEAR